MIIDSDNATLVCKKGESEKVKDVYKQLEDKNILVCLLLWGKTTLYLASAGDIGGMMGKKFGFGWSLDLPVIRQ